MLQLRPEGRGWRLSVTQIDGRDHRQVGGFDLTAAEWPTFLAVVRALGPYARGDLRRPSIPPIVAEYLGILWPGASQPLPHSRLFP